MKIKHPWGFFMWLTFLAAIAVILCVSQDAHGGINSNQVEVANSILRQLRVDTNGVDACTRAEALVFARDGLAQAGTDIGVAFAKRCISTAGVMAMLIDTALIKIDYIAIDSVVDDDYLIPVRQLTSAPLDTVLDVAQSGNGVRDEINATHYNNPDGLDSVYLAPVSSDADTFFVIGWKRDDLSTDSTATTNLPQEYRHLAVLWGLHLASQMLENGRSTEFEGEYWRRVTMIWRRRDNPRTWYLDMGQK